MPGGWRTQTTTVQSVVVEVCWRPMEGDVAGDFYDVVDLRNGRVAVIVGDAPGFGPRAAALADELRSELRHGFRESPDVVAIMSRLDHVLTRVGEELIATLTCAVIDPRARQVEITNAGHLPIMRTTLADAVFLNGHVDPPLGVASERRVATEAFDNDVTLFLYTDGLVERRDTSLDESLAVLLATSSGMTGASAWASELARRVTQRLGQPADDATVVSVALNPTLAADEPGRRRPEVRHRRRVQLRVYVDPTDLRSAHAEAVVNDLAFRLRHHYDVRVETVDLTAVDADIETHGVLATPTVVRVSPEPVVRVIGGLRSVGDLARALQLPLQEEDQ